MNKRSLGALLALNGVLLAALAVVSLAPLPAQAQPVIRSQYSMVAGRVLGRDQSAIYIFDLNTYRVVSVIFNSGDKTLTTVGGRDLAQDLREGSTGR